MQPHDRECLEDKVQDEPLIGVVKRWSDGKGYGFIEHPVGDVFVHYSAIDQPGIRKNLQPGQHVQFAFEVGTLNIQ